VDNEGGPTGPGGNVRFSTGGQNIDPNEIFRVFFGGGPDMFNFEEDSPTGTGGYRGFSTSGDGGKKTFTFTTSSTGGGSPNFGGFRTGASGMPNFGGFNAGAGGMPNFGGFTGASSPGGSSGMPNFNFAGFNKNAKTNTTGAGSQQTKK
jgi:hypothetical protein